MRVVVKIGLIRCVMAFLSPGLTCWAVWCLAITHNCWLNSYLSQLKPLCLLSSDLGHQDLSSHRIALEGCFVVGCFRVVCIFVNKRQYVALTMAYSCGSGLTSPIKFTEWINWCVMRFVVYLELWFCALWCCYIQYLHDWVTSQVGVEVFPKCSLAAGYDSTVWALWFRSPSCSTPPVVFYAVLIYSMLLCQFIIIGWESCNYTDYTHCAFFCSSL